MFEIPEALHIAIVGILTYVVMKGLQNKFPGIEGSIARVISIVVASLLATLTELINVNVDPIFFPVLREAILLLAAVIAGWGMKEIEKTFRPKKKQTYACEQKFVRYGAVIFRPIPNKLSDFRNMATRVVAC